MPVDSNSLAPAVDLELKGNCRERPDGVTVERELTTFLRSVESTMGKVMVLYVGDDFEDRYPVRTSFQRPLWHRRFLRRPDVDDWVIWQVHGSARVDGVKGRVDFNVMRQPPRRRTAPPSRPRARVSSLQPLLNRKARSQPRLSTS